MVTSPGAGAAHEEQPHPGGGPRRGQDGHRGGPRAARGHQGRAGGPQGAEGKRDAPIDSIDAYIYVYVYVYIYVCLYVDV